MGNLPWRSPISGISISVMNNGKADGRLFAVGDIHGCDDALQRLLGRMPFSPAADTIVFLGDYVNRGPKSRQVMERLVSLEQGCPGAVFLMGNHERALLEYARTGDRALLDMLRARGVEATLDSYENSPMHSLKDLSFLPGEHLAFLQRLRFFHRERGYLFVHAGIEPGVPPEENRPDTLLNIRGLFLQDPTDIEETVVFGHTPFETPLVAAGKIGIDTGAAYGNVLTAVELATAQDAPRGPLRFFHA